MHGSSPLPSPPSPGSGARPSNAAIPASSASAVNPDAAILAAHERLAELDPFSDRERLFDGVLAALLTAAHASEASSWILCGRLARTPERPETRRSRSP